MAHQDCVDHYLKHRVNRATDGAGAQIFVGPGIQVCAFYEVVDENHQKAWHSGVEQHEDLSLVGKKKGKKRVCKKLGGNNKREHGKIMQTHLQRVLTADQCWWHEYLNFLTMDVLQRQGLHLIFACDQLFDGKPQLQHQVGHEGLHMFKKS